MYNSHSAFIGGSTCKVSNYHASNLCHSPVFHKTEVIISGPFLLLDSIEDDQHSLFSFKESQCIPLVTFLYLSVSLALFLSLFLSLSVYIYFICIKIKTITHNSLGLSLEKIHGDWLPAKQTIMLITWNPIPPPDARMEPVPL